MHPAVGDRAVGAVPAFPRERRWWVLGRRVATVAGTAPPAVQVAAFATIAVVLVAEAMLHRWAAGTAPAGVANSPAH